MDRDSNWNFIIGGQSQSSDIISPLSVPNPFILFLNLAGQIQWAKQFPSIYDSVEVVKFDSSSPLNILTVLNKINGQGSIIVIF
jgi:hypothetical protein